MDLKQTPVGKVMSSDLITLAPEDKLIEVKKIFDKYRIHHIPIVRGKTIIGIVSYTDYVHFVRGYTQSEEDKQKDDERLNSFTTEQIMTRGLAKLDPGDRINVAIEVFKVNLFHAIPVVENDELVGIVTTHDIIRLLAEEG